MSRLITIFAAAAALLAVLALPGVASAKALTVAEAKKVVAAEAKKVQRDLRSEGARRSGVPGCWRNSQLRVSCFIAVSGYDAEGDFRWKCMMRAVVRANPRATTAAKRYRLTYGTPHCG